MKSAIQSVMSFFHCHSILVLHLSVETIEMFHVLNTYMLNLHGVAAETKDLK